MIGPHLTLGPSGGGQRASVVDEGHAELGSMARFVICARTLWQAAVSSASVRGPCSRSHSATAASPSRTSRARQAASVIHADTRDTLLRGGVQIPGVNVGLDVIASFGEGLPGHGAAAGGQRATEIGRSGHQIE